MALPIALAYVVALVMFCDYQIVCLISRATSRAKSRYNTVDIATKMRHWSDDVLMYTGILCAIFTQEKLFAVCLINNFTFKVLGLIKNFFYQGVLHAELIKYFNLPYVYA